MRRLMLALLLMPTPLLAQTSAAPTPDTAPAVGPGPLGAQQVVGLFMATCLQFGANRDQMRGFLQQQGARAVPPPTRDLFLRGRPGVVYDASYRTTHLALVSLDNGGCEAVSEFADPTLVVADLGQALAQARIPAQPQGPNMVDPKNPAIHHQAYAIAGSSTGGHAATIVAATSARGTPQAVLTLTPQEAVPGQPAPPPPGPPATAPLPP